jgi:uncharacterized membrane protein YqhA
VDRSICFYIEMVGFTLLSTKINPQQKEAYSFLSLDNLKEKLLAGEVVVLAVFFLSQLVSWNSGIDLLYLGLGIAAIIAAMKYSLSGKEKAPKDNADQ